MNRFLLSLALFTMAAVNVNAQSFDFSTAISTGAQAPGVWYVDRYEPNIFATAPFDGDDRLFQYIDYPEAGQDRPVAFQSNFYNTQGYKYDLNPGMTALKIDLYMTDLFETSNKRMAGIWGTAVDSVNAVSAYPIVEFTSDGNNPRFRGYEGDGSWIDLGLPTGFAYDTWVTLEIAMLPSGEFKYTAGDKTATTLLMGSANVELANVILQGHNTFEGVTYGIYWDNLSAVPEPNSIALAVGSLLSLLAVRRRK